MVDLKKEIKLSDLKPKRKPKQTGAQVSSPKSRKPRKQELVGIKVGASQLAAAQVVNDNGARLIRVARTDIEPGLVVAGEVRDIPGLAHALDDFFAEHKLPRKNVRLGIGTNRVGVRTLDVAGIEDERQLGNAVAFKAYEALAIPMDQAILDYHLLGTTRSDTGEVTHRVVLAAAYREPIDHFVAAFQAANVELTGIDVEAFALLRAVAPANSSQAGDGEKAAIVALAVGHDRSTLAISDGEVCDFTRVLEWGGSKLDVAIGRELGLAQEEAAELKRAVDLRDADWAGEGSDDPRVGRAREAVKRELVNLARELIASLQFYQGQAGSHAIGEILVTGGTTRMPGFVEELERLIRARVRIADPLAAVQVGAPEVAARDDLASFAVAIGLGVDV
jgi:type IV pilus assembly protein PilM